MTLWQTAVVAFLTAAYLCVELAFNARLLDVVGGAATAAQLHDIERYGRGLSGVAVALVLLQVLLGRRSRSATGSPRGMAILFWCLVAAGLTYGLLQLLVDQLVERSTPELRRTGQNIVLVQRALVSGGVKLDGLDDDPGLFARPEGKAFLALFPLMAMSVDRLDDKIRDAKRMLIEREVADRTGGAAGHYQQYAQAVSNTQAQWQRYRRLPRAGGITIQGRRVLGGLGWGAFFAHPAVQAELREKLNLPAQVALQPGYASGVVFKREVFDPMVQDVARRELARYNAPAQRFADGQIHADAGRDAVRSVIVPPMALLFSLLGAIGHFAKLCYLLLRLGAAFRPAWRQRARHLWIAPVGVMALVWSLLSATDNPVTQSRLYTYMRAQLLQGGPAGHASGLQARVTAHVLHVVAVGQGMGYPLNERVRTQLLGGVTFGYQAPSR